VAEGIENQLQADFLRDQGCDELQGYLFSKPVSSTKIPALLHPSRGQAVS
jgi:EAL domain-containing protein (putative c-di-GMP-specific phosphodiesterase class I)